MKRKLLTVLLVLSLVLSMIPFTASAAEQTHVELTFDPATGITDTGGRTWTAVEGVADYTGNRANLSAARYGTTSGITGLVSDINNQLDFYIETKVKFLNFNTPNQRIYYKSDLYNEFSLAYDKSTGLFGYRYSTTTMGDRSGTFPTTFNLNADQDYVIVYGRDGDNMVLYVDGVSAGTVALGGASLRASTSNKVYLGYPTTFSAISMATFKIVGDAAYDPAAASSVSEDDGTSVAVTGGSLELSTGAVSFSGIVFDTGTVQTVTSASSATVSDDRVSGAGWSLKVSSTDFLSQSIVDPSGGTGNVVLRIPASSLSVVPGAVTVSAGQAVNATHGPLAASLTLNSSQQTLFSAATGYGMGLYTLPLVYTLTLPKTATVVSVSGTGSKYASGDVVGTTSSTYEATITYTLGTGL